MRIRVTDVLSPIQFRGALREAVACPGAAVNFAARDLLAHDVAQRAECRTLREALEPFARYADATAERLPDSVAVVTQTRTGSGVREDLAITLGHLRAARAALAHTEATE